MVWVVVLVSNGEYRIFDMVRGTTVLVVIPTSFSLTVWPSVEKMSDCNVVEVDLEYWTVPDRDCAVVEDVDVMML